MQVHIMILSLNEAEKFLIEKNLITQHELQELKEKSRIGRLNCFCESVFGHLKNREMTSAKAALETTVSLTVAKMNDTKSYLKKMSRSKREEMWNAIDDKSTLQKIKTAREDLKKSLREQANASKEAKRAKMKKTAENKRKREEKKKNTSIKPTKMKIS
jgi:hypothetical protein